MAMAVMGMTRRVERRRMEGILLLSVSGVGWFVV
jgi:hypothetical protein